MFKLNGYELNGIEYIVIDDRDIFVNTASLELLASRKYGVGADRLLLVSVEAGKLLSVMDNGCRVQIPTSDDYQVFASFLNGKGEGMVSCCELRLTDYFLQQLITAGSIGDKVAC